MKKSVKILAGITAFLLMGAILYFTNGLVGNPISKSIANNKVKEYVAREYSDMDLDVEDVYYSFKDGRYHAEVKSPSSKDTHFEISISSFGKIEFDSYENDVLKKYNTYTRINDTYGKKVMRLFESKDFPYKSEIAFGEIKDIESVEVSEEFSFPVYGIDIKTLELDKEYDMNVLGKEAGNIVFYAEDEDISVKKASEILLDLKNILDENNIYFYAIDFTLEKPRNEDGTVRDDESISVEQFLYKDINKDGLESRIEKADENLKKYYEVLDKEKQLQDEKYK